MSEYRFSGRLVNPQQAYALLMSIYEQIKPWLMADHAFRLTIKPDTRSLEQNAKFHALCSDIAKSGAQWAGKARTAEQWKVLLISGHAMATKQGSEMVPGLEGEYVNIRESSAQMSAKRASSLIEYTQAWCAINGVRLPTYKENQ